MLIVVWWCCVASSLAGGGSNTCTTKGGANIGAQEGGTAAVHTNAAAFQKATGLG
jgi:hypothetical protein